LKREFQTRAENAFSVLTRSAAFRHSRLFVSPEVNPPPFSQLCERISAELFAARLTDPRHLAFLAALYRLALVDDEQDDS